MFPKHYGYIIGRYICYVILSILPVFLAGCKPTVTIISPSDGAVFNDGEQIDFVGEATDIIEGELTGGSLVWISDKDGKIGTGTSFSRNNLSKGTHEITLTATNSSGESASATVSITVGEEQPSSTTTTIDSSLCPEDEPVVCVFNEEQYWCCEEGTICGDVEYEDGQPYGTCIEDNGSSTTTTTLPDISKEKIHLSTDPGSDLLFYIAHDDGSWMYYYGLSENGTMKLTHIIFSDSSGNTSAVIFSPDLIAAQWIMDNLTIVVYNIDEVFDPHNALHVIAEGTAEEDITLDIYPNNLSLVIDAMESETGETFTQARTFLDTHQISSFSDLVALAKQKGQEQPRYIAAAVGFSAAASALTLQTLEPEASGSSLMPLQVPFKPLIQIAAGAIAGIINDEFGPGSDPDPDEPVVQLLLCRGVAKYGICHYMFFKRPGNEVGPCIDLCLTSTRCFTDICMPKELSVAEALEYQDVTFSAQ